MNNNDDSLKLEDFEIDGIEISEFLESTIEENGDSVSKVMAASCTSCECCCSY